MLSPSVDNLVAQLTRLPGIGSRTAQRLAFHILAHAEGRGGRPRARDRGGQGTRPLLQGVRQPDRGGALRDLPRHAPRPHRRLRRRAAGRRDLARADARVSRPLPRPRRLALAPRRRRARAPADRRAAAPRRHRRDQGGRARDESEHDGRGDGRLPGRPAPRPRHRDAARQWASRSAATSSMRTRSPSAARSPAAARFDHQGAIVSRKILKLRASNSGFSHRTWPAWFDDRWIFALFANFFASDHLRSEGQQKYIPGAEPVGLRVRRFSIFRGFFRGAGGAPLGFPHMSPSEPQPADRRRRRDRRRRQRSRSSCCASAATRTCASSRPLGPPARSSAASSSRRRRPKRSRPATSTSASSRSARRRRASSSPMPSQAARSASTSRRPTGSSRESRSSCRR